MQSVDLQTDGDYDILTLECDNRTFWDFVLFRKRIKSESFRRYKKGNWYRCEDMKPVSPSESRRIVSAMGHIELMEKMFKDFKWTLKK